jgi:hypothetical protein
LNQFPAVAGINKNKNKNKKNKNMNINELKKSNFLTRGDVGKGMLVTIKGVHQENVAKDGAPEELRWCLDFNEAEKPCVLNSTNGQLIAKITGSEDSDRWTGHKIVLYDDPSVSFGGKLVGGIRVRAPRNQPAAKPAAKAVPAPEPSDNDGGPGDEENPNF